MKLRRRRSWAATIRTVAKLLKVVAADTGGSDGSSGVVLEPWILLQLDEDLQRARCIVVDGDASLLLPGHAHEFNLTHVDEVIDELLTTDYSCDIAMPRIKKMWTLESLGSLEPRQSALEEDFEEEEENEDNEQPADELEEKTHEKDYYRGRIPARERDRDRRRESHRHRFLCTDSVHLRSMMGQTAMLHW
ncbi:pre-mRNA-splicing factor 38-like isoform X2 [Vicia villosa]|uniref:pre-mRNA-splicing factor 38-like isoform X2 n=1 Tax=Vicia villosa TaxID=3911 RepID=UPI00273ABE33|nr:pre-mRNA-splicing factor 38-like isoform X2 [Vicia villosa]